MTSISAGRVTRLWFLSGTKREGEWIKQVTRAAALPALHRQGFQAFYHRLPTPAIVTFPIVASRSGPDKDDPGAKNLFTIFL